MRKNRFKDNPNVVLKWEFANNNKKLIAERYEYDMTLNDTQKEEGDNGL